MDATLEAFLESWSLDPWIFVPLALTTWVYLRGWRALRRRGSRHFDQAQPACFVAGVGALFLALCSPLDPFAGLLLQVHMIQHLLLMMVAPPLLLLGAPALPLLRGLPGPVRRYWVAPWLRAGPLRATFRSLTHPVVAWGLFAVSTWLWHWPPLYEAALRSDGWHYVEHGCFLGTGLLFWWPVVQPYPSRPHWSRWAVLPYLFLADVQNTLLSALLAFSPRLLYPHYAAVPRLWGLSPLEDQGAAGVIMWVPGSLIYLLPLLVIGARLLYGEAPSWQRRETGPVRASGRGRIALPMLSMAGGTSGQWAGAARHHPAPPSQAWDLLKLPLVGWFLKWRHARITMQAPLVLLSAAIILDGWFGPQVAPMNLAGVLPWIHWRGLVVLGLLVAGNVFCMGCPFMLPRNLARRWLRGRRPWPSWFRGKWPAVLLLVLFFWAYETFALWASPWWTAWIALGYFLAAFVIDGCFRGAAFCKHVCPIGQFHFVQSLTSPLEVGVRDPATCLTCATRDCIRGRPPHPQPLSPGGRGENSEPLSPGERGSGGIPGCELHLFQPRKAGNVDCTFCLDCVHACPHDNVGILAVLPGARLLDDRPRSGVGRFSRRPDLAALVLVLVFGAFANAAGMVAPVVSGASRLAGDIGLEGTGAVVTVGLLGALVVAPVFLVGSAALLGRWWSGDAGRPLTVATRFSFTLAPLGGGMWLAHYLFHFLTGAGGFWPVVQRVAGDLGTSFLGEPAWQCACCMTRISWLLPLEIVCLDLGLLLSLYAGYRAALERCPRPGQALRAFAPWALLMLLLFAAGLWVLFQPMQMRGTM